MLPPPSSLARSHYDLAFAGLSVRNIAKWSAPIVAPDGPEENEILARLALIASGQGADADPSLIDDFVLGALLERATREPELAGTSASELGALLQATHPTDRAVEIMIRSGPYGDLFGRRPGGLDFDTLAANPHGIDLGPLQPRIPEILSTPSGSIELMTDPIRTEFARLRAVLNNGPDVGVHPRGDQLVLIGRRHLRSNNSWMHNIDVLVKGKDRCTLLVNPVDAKRLGLVDGKQAKVVSKVGELVVPVEISETIMAGVVSLPHGWGHDLPGVRQSVTRARPGVNSNLLTDDSQLDPLSGNAVLSGIPVEIAPA
ncbi:MAG: molybdopterin oxidoreductase family protein [Acidimicrobiales bacterium]|nr:molybdopterin oxidoreductase family protein [Acidimicrobiales bacterium]